MANENRGRSLKIRKKCWKQACCGVINTRTMRRAMVMLLGNYELRFISVRSRFLQTSETAFLIYVLTVVHVIIGNTAFFVETYLEELYCNNYNVTQKSWVKTEHKRRKDSVLFWIVFSILLLFFYHRELLKASN